MNELEQRYLHAKRKAFALQYDRLNDKQKEVVFHTQGPLLVLAGAGSGKTTVLVQRIAFLLQYGNAYESDEIPFDLSEAVVKRLEQANELTKEERAELLESCAVLPCNPWQVLSITFTNKAANEMKERLALTVGDSANEIWAGTFHSICVRILRRFGEHLGYRPGFTIYDTDDVKKQINACLKELNIDDKMVPIKTAMNTISRAKDMLLTPAMFAKEAQSDFVAQKIAQIYEVYQNHLKQANAMDFDDLIFQTVTLLSQNDEVREFYQNRFRYVCVDEYQDTNCAQSRLIYLLSGKYRNLMVVGDDDQSIYKFRGATIENILQFDSIFPDARVIKLEQNYRSTQIILNAANALIDNNRTRKGKALWTSHEGGEKIVVRRLMTQNEEARFISARILNDVSAKKHTYSDYAVLYRTNAQSNALEQVFSKSGVPYRMMGGTRFYERKEIKDILAYLCVIENPADDLRLKRIINEPKRKIGDTTIRALETLARSENTSMLQIIHRATEFSALSRVAPTLQTFSDLILDLQAQKDTLPLPQFISTVFEKSGYQAMLEAQGILEIDRIQNIKELISNAVLYDSDHENATLSGFLEEIALISDIDNYDQNANAVVMMTIHSAKGLEFPIVFLPGMEEGLFPSRQSELNEADLEEERRLAYVAITRAKEKLYCLHTKERLLYGQTQYNPPSRFLKELPENCLDAESPDQKREYVPQNRQKLSQAFTNKPFACAPQSVKKTPSPREQFQIGEAVIHPNFGRGMILSKRPMGTDCLYEIAFDTVGTKKLMGNYAKLEKA